MTTNDSHPVTGAWNDPARPAAARAQALLEAMTVAEKVAQLGSTWPGVVLDNEPPAMKEAVQRAEPFDKAVIDGLGQLTRIFGTAPVEPAAGRSQLAALQAQVVAANRFGIPAIAHEECLTGVTAWQATVYPTSLAWAAAWDPGLVHEMAAAIGSDLAACGVHQGMAPVLDVVRDYRWGRVEETLGEDPYLVGELGTAYVRGLQSAGVIATLKHFAGHSASRGARNHTPASIGPRELADVILPPFEQAIVVGGARSVMNAYNEIDGVPSAADKSLFTELLRERWGFEGTVVTDYWAIAFLASLHHVAGDLAGATALALEAGMDVELPHTACYDQSLIDMVDEGRVPVELLDRAVLRVLSQKAELGLLDPDWRPDRLQQPLDLNSPRNRDVARRIAEQSVVMLANGSAVLPLAAPRSIAVIGPAADDVRSLFGCYSFPNHVLPDHPGTPLGIEAPTVLDAIRSEFPQAAISHVAGCDYTAEDRDELAAAVAAAEAADLTVLVVGDRSGLFGQATSGEGCDVSSLRLPGIQDELASAVLAAAGRAVLVVVSGRPYAIGRHAAQADATLQAFMPGQAGGAAIAGVLSGRVAPGGRLPVQIPGDAAGQPGTYLAPELEVSNEGMSNLDPSPAFPFGYGLAHTSFTITDVRADESVAAVDGSMTVHATVTNSGDQAGTAVPQLYLTDPVATVTRPVRRLVGFARLELAAGEARTLSFEVHADLTSFTGLDLRRRVEPGEFVLTVAQSAADPGSSVSVDLVGDTRFVDHTREFSSRIRSGEE